MNSPTENEDEMLEDYDDIVLHLSESEEYDSDSEFGTDSDVTMSELNFSSASDSDTETAMETDSEFEDDLWKPAPLPRSTLNRTIDDQYQRLTNDYDENVHYYQPTLQYSFSKNSNGPVVWSKPSTPYPTKAMLKYLEENSVES